MKQGDFGILAILLVVGTLSVTWLPTLAIWVTALTSPAGTELDADNRGVRDALLFASAIVALAGILLAAYAVRTGANGGLMGYVGLFVALLAAGLTILDVSSGEGSVPKVSEVTATLYLYGVAAVLFLGPLAFPAFRRSDDVFSFYARIGGCTLIAVLVGMICQAALELLWGDSAFRHAEKFLVAPAAAIACSAAWASVTLYHRPLNRTPPPLWIGAFVVLGVLLAYGYGALEYGPRKPWLVDAGFGGAWAGMVSLGLLIGPLAIAHAFGLRAAPRRAIPIGVGGGVIGTIAVILLANALAPAMEHVGPDRIAPFVATHLLTMLCTVLACWTAENALKRLPSPPQAGEP